MIFRKSCIGFFLLISLLAVFSPWAMAHKIHIFAYLDNGTVYTESYFSDGRPVVGGSVQAVDADNQQQAKGTSDAKGMFSFPYSGNNNLTLTIKATMGHRATYLLPIKQ